MCARKTHRLLIDAWMNGLFPTFDYALTRYLFSTCIVLAISSLSQDQWPNTESDEFEAAVQVLDQLGQNGSQAASEFSRHVEATRSLMESHRSAQRQGENDRASVRASAVPNVANPAGLEGWRTDADAYTAGFHLSEPSLQDLLSLPHLDLDTLETPFSNDGFQSFYWPDLGVDNYPS